MSALWDIGAHDLDIQIEGEKKALKNGKENELPKGLTVSSGSQYCSLRPEPVYRAIFHTHCNNTWEEMYLKVF